MNLSCARIFPLLLAWGTAGLPATKGAAPIDVTQRNAEFSTGAATSPVGPTPQVDHAIQDRRVEKNVLPKPSAGAMPRAAIEATESFPKPRREAPGEALAPLPPRVNPETQRASLPDRVKQPQKVKRYEDSLAAARATSLARYPELQTGAAPAKLNRFVFRKNVPEPALVTPASGPAAGSGGAK
jgi:hypothetical protein